MRPARYGHCGGAIVFLDGQYEDTAYYMSRAGEADLVVAADGAAAFLLECGIQPDVVVGDFDSLSELARDELRRKDVEVLPYPVRKDATDGELAVAEALRRGACRIQLAGALGALDHTLGHLAILRRLAAAGIEARLVSPAVAVKVLIGSVRSELDSPPRTRVSLVSLASDAIVTLEGFEYPLSRVPLPCDACLGLGNEIVTQRASIQVHEGVVVVLVASGSESFGERLQE